MKSVQRKVLGVEFSNQEPENPSEYDSLAKREGACVSDASNQVFYHSQAGDIRSAVVEAAEKLTGVAQRTKKVTKGDKEVEVVDEKDADYIDRLKTEGKLTNEQLATLVADAAKANPFDPSVSAREAKPKKLPQEYADAAAKVFANGNGAKWMKKLGVVSTDVEADNIIALGWAIRTDVLAKQRAAVANFA